MTPNPSAGVRLEVAILAADQETLSNSATLGGELERLTVLVVSAESDVRRHVRECLRDCVDMRVLEAPSVAVALTLEAQANPHVLVVDATLGEVLVALPRARAIVLVDDDPRREPAADARVRFLARPFTADQLVTEVELLRR
jgi:hypothetical protein